MTCLKEYLVIAINSFCLRLIPMPWEAKNDAKIVQNMTSITLLLPFGVSGFWTFTYKNCRKNFWLKVIDSSLVSYHQSLIIVWHTISCISIFPFDFNFSMLHQYNIRDILHPFHPWFTVFRNENRYRDDNQSKNLY